MSSSSSSSSSNWRRRRRRRRRSRRERVREKRRPIFIHVFIGDWGGRRRGEGKERRGGSKCCFNTIQITYACAFCLRLKRREKRKRRRERKNEKEEEEEVEKKGMPQCACAPFFPSSPPPFSHLSSIYVPPSIYLGGRRKQHQSAFTQYQTSRERKRGSLKRVR